MQQSVEFGYRDSMISGNMNTYDTFENLSSGMRLFDYTVNMRFDRSQRPIVRQSVL